MGEKDFTRRECIRALERLGFMLRNKHHGGHDKYLPPPAIIDQLSDHQPRFIMVPRHRDLRCQQNILVELKRMGGEELMRSFIDEL